MIKTNEFNEWRSNESHFFVDNSSDILIVTFSGCEIENSNIINRFISNNFTHVDQLYVRDSTENMTAAWYLHKIEYNNTSDAEKSVVTGVEEIKNWLHTLITKKTYKKILAIGYCSGGFGAILYNYMLKFDKCIAFSPQTLLIEQQKSDLPDHRFSSSIKNINDVYKDNKKFLDLKNFRIKNTIIHYGAHNNEDVKHALRLDCEHVSYKTNVHSIANYLLDNDLLTTIISDTILSFQITIGQKYISELNRFINIKDNFEIEQKEKEKEKELKKNTQNIIKHHIEYIPENMYENIPENMHGDIPENMHGDIPENMHGDIPENMHEDISDNIPENMHDDISDNILDNSE